MDRGVGEVSSGVFTTSKSLWNELYAAGLREHDRFWRTPLDEEYDSPTYEHDADITSIRFPLASPPALYPFMHRMRRLEAHLLGAAPFLKSFIQDVEPSAGADKPAVLWMHLDITWPRMYLCIYRTIMERRSGV
ncbi:hypothetical protein TRAPUB_3656 [Trametes pubescens]|uniref:Cytosol aminopeptidase domain-containing protein n=1 Tax=Trametes pubescens TaxID=154538 RepID=A0A1M2VD82_TRAPU|nr:hypothetical protein TRAPUB_3656 [Trametes pubescens]